MRRHKLICLEKAGLVQEVRDCGYGAAVTSGMSELNPSGDGVEDERLRAYMIRKAREDAIARDRRMRRLRKLARMDFKMVGGVAPIGFYGGGGGEGPSMRPGSMSARS